MTAAGLLGGEAGSQTGRGNINFSVFLSARLLFVWSKLQKKTAAPNVQSCFSLFVFFFFQCRDALTTFDHVYQM